MIPFIYTITHSPYCLYSAIYPLPSAYIPSTILFCPTCYTFYLVLPCHCLHTPYCSACLLFAPLCHMPHIPHTYHCSCLTYLPAISVPLTFDPHSRLQHTNAGCCCDMTFCPRGDLTNLFFAYYPTFATYAVPRTACYRPPLTSFQPPTNEPRLVA